MARQSQKKSPKPAAKPPDLLAGEDLPREPRQERSRRAREALLDAALVLFAERGFEATSVEDMAMRAGVAVGGFYSHFRSKRQLLLVLMDRLLRELAALDLTVPPAVPSRAVVAVLVQVALRVDWAYMGAYRAWNELVARDGELAAHHRAIESWSLSRLRAVVDALARRPEARAGLDIDTLCWVTNQLFWRMTGIEVENRAAIERSIAEMLSHALFEDAPHD